MRNLLIALAGATALTAASAANAAVTIGATGSSCTGTGCLAGTTGATVTNTVTTPPPPDSLTFDTVNGMGTVTSFFNFMVGSNEQGVFSATTATIPFSTVTMLQLLTGGTIGGSAGTNQIAVSNGTGQSLSLTSGTLVPGTVYTFEYTANLATRGNIAGPANFYPAAAVPEPAAWALMLLGFGGIGMAMRRRRRPVLAQIA